MTAIDAKDIKYVYMADEENIHIALSGVTLDVEQGEFVAILGHNGSGKSTFAKHINVLLKLQEGGLLVLGMDARDELLTWDIRSRAGMVFQNPDNQIVSTIVEEDVAFGPENLGVPREEIINRVKEALEAVDMAGYAKHAPHMLSGGQKQRVAIAGVLAMHPDIIVFDEATAMLDPKGRDEIMGTIRYLNKERKKTIVLITHFMEEAVECDRVFVMNRGKIIDQGTPREVFAHADKLSEAGLMPPFAAQAAKRLKERGIDLKKHPLTLYELVEEICRLK